MNRSSNYTFPGLWPFIEGVAQGRDLHHLGRARELWHCKQIQDALGQLPRLDPASRRQLVHHVLKVRQSLAVALEGIDAAVVHVCRQLDLLPLEENPSPPDDGFQPNHRDCAESSVPAATPDDGFQPNHRDCAESSVPAATPGGFPGASDLRRSARESSVPAVARSGGTSPTHSATHRQHSPRNPGGGPTAGRPA